MQAIFPREYFVYCKGKWCGIGEKAPLFWRFASFQIRPNVGVLFGLLLRETQGFLSCGGTRKEHPPSIWAVRKTQEVIWEW